MSEDKLVIEVGDEDFQAVVLESDVPVLVDLWAPWCGPCKAASPIVHAVAQAFEGRAKVVKVNVDAAPAVAGSFPVQGIPAFLFFHKGEAVGLSSAPAPISRSS